MSLSERFYLRLPPAEAAELRRRAAAAGLTVADYIRSVLAPGCVTGTAPPVKRVRRVYTPADPELLRHLAAIGNNINQLARWANTYKSHADALPLLLELFTIRRSLHALLSAEVARNRVRGGGDAD